MGGSTPNALLDPDLCNDITLAIAVGRTLGTNDVGLTVLKGIYLL